MTSTRAGGTRIRSEPTTTASRTVVPSVSSRIAGIKQRMTCAAELQAAVAGDRRRAALHAPRELGLRVQLVELGRGVERARQFLGARAEGVRQRPKNPADLGQLTLGQRDDLVVERDRRQRLEVHARAARGRAVDDARESRRDARRARRRRSVRCDR